MFLCVCQYGHSRSAAAARLFHRHSIEAIAVGFKTSPNALQDLSRLAELIIVMEYGYENHIPEAYRRKVCICNVGKDIWRNPYDDELIEFLKPRIGIIVEEYRNVQIRGTTNETFETLS